MPATLILTVLAFVSLCILSDVHARRIPNPLSVAGMVAGLMLNIIHFGGAGIAASVAGFALATALLIAPFAAGGVGGGDVKMMAAVGAMLGPRLVTLSLGLGILLGGFIAVWFAARRGVLRRTLTGIVSRARDAVLMRTLAPLRMLPADGSGLTLPYSIPLGLGAMLALLSVKP